MKISPARRAAYQVLYRVETKRAFTSVLLPQYGEGLSDADRGLFHEITLGSLRRQIYIDRVIDHFARGKRIDMEVRVALRLGVYQLYFLDKIPAYSAINESVNLVQAAKKSSAKAFVNAILRRASEGRPELAFVDEIDQISVESSHPRWMIERWADRYGAAEASAIAFANNQNSACCFRFLRDASDEGKRLMSLAEESPNIPGCFRIDGQGAMLNRLVESGEIYVQDEGSQMVAHSFGEIEGLFLDVCAAPGGKTGLIAKLHPETHVIAGDLHIKRVNYLAENCRRQGVLVEIVQYDAVKGLPFADMMFDAVLVDAPCSGTGTIRSNPELRYHIEPDDFNALQNKQLEILRNASNLVRRGGKLVYSTCSLEREENEAVIEKLLGEAPGFSRVRPDVPPEFVTAEGFARTWPHRDQMDGFFIGKFVRNEA